MAPWGKKHKKSQEANTGAGSKDIVTAPSMAAGLSLRSALPTENYSYGIKIWAGPTEMHNVDIVFVHGLTGNREGTWSAEGDYLWPEQLLPKKFPGARIMGFGYDADIVNFWSQAGINKIGQHAESLVATLADERNDCEDVPIIFVAHSLGGIVITDALATSKKSSEEHMKRIWDSTRGIIFMGTPLRGATLADWAAIGASFVKLFRRTNVPLLSTLQRDSEVLERIRKDFMTQLKARYDTGGKTLKLKCFTEEVPVVGVGLIVQPDSASIEGWQTSRAIHANHMDMTKFTSGEDPGYKAVSAEIARWIKDFDKPSISPTVPADGNARDSMVISQNHPVTAVPGNLNQGGNTFSGTNVTYGGKVYQGNFAGHDFTFN